MEVSSRVNVTCKIQKKNFRKIFSVDHDNGQGRYFHLSLDYQGMIWLNQFIISELEVDGKVNSFAECHLTFRKMREIRGWEEYALRKRANNWLEIPSKCTDTILQEQNQPVTAS